MSWNFLVRVIAYKFEVTLHVSVWVEIKIVATLQLFKQSRSTWACELKFTISLNFVSSALSRSTWACELKCIICTVCSCHWSHAPRERVSWNLYTRSKGDTCKVTLHVSVWVEMFLHVYVTIFWYVTLHVSVWVEILLIPYNQQLFWSRSTWACELKYSL